MTTLAGVSGLLSVNEAADIIGVDGSRVRQWIGEGRLKAERVGGRWVLRESVVLKFAAIERYPGRPPK